MVVCEGRNCDVTANFVSLFVSPQTAPVDLNSFVRTQTKASRFELLFVSSHTVLISLKFVCEDTNEGIEIFFKAN